MYLDPKIWGPHYWFFLHTLAMTYPHYPNASTKKKYYEFIQNLHLFIPVENHSLEFTKLINEYPVTPYLDNRQSFIKWMHFIHNQINIKLEKPTMSLSDFFINYYNNYKNTDIKFNYYRKLLSKIIYFIVIIILCLIIYFGYIKFIK